MVQNTIRIPVSPRQRNIQPNINPQHPFQPNHQKVPIHFVHNQISKVENEPIIQNLKTADRNLHKIE